jgi:hypothetical protein
VVLHAVATEAAPRCQLVVGREELLVVVLGQSHEIVPANLFKQTQTEGRADDKSVFFDPLVATLTAPVVGLENL